LTSSSTFEDYFLTMVQNLFWRPGEKSRVLQGGVHFFFFF
jgi:hypothetical protein